MLEKNGIERKIAIFATLAVVLLIGIAFVPAAEGRPDERETPGEEIEISEKARRKQMEVAQQIELKDGQLYLPEEEAKRTGINRGTLVHIERTIQALNRLKNRGIINFEKVTIETPSGSEKTIRIEKTDEVENTESANILGSGKNDWDYSTQYYGYKLELWMDHSTTQDVIDAAHVGAGVATIISGIIASSGVGIPIAGIPAIIAGILVVEATLLDRNDGGEGVKVTTHIAWSGTVLWHNIDGQHEDGDWWPWSQRESVTQDELEREEYLAKA